jgi:hypothetical protein
MASIEVTIDNAEIAEFRVEFIKLNNMMRAIYKAYTETNPESDKHQRLLKAITKYGGGPIRELFWLFTGVRCREYVKDFLEHLDTLEKLTAKQMLDGITSKEYGPNYGCFHEQAKQIKQYMERYFHLVPPVNPLPQNMAALCASAHNISSLRKLCRTRKIDDKVANNQRQRLETRILAKLGPWMQKLYESRAVADGGHWTSGDGNFSRDDGTKWHGTDEEEKAKVSWVAYLEQVQLTKMPSDVATTITDSIEDWLIAMRAIEHAYVLLRKNADLQDKVPPGDLAFIGWEVSEVNGGPGLRVVVNQNTHARWINWEGAARDGVYPIEIKGKPSSYGMSSGTTLRGYDIGMD